MAAHQMPRGYAATASADSGIAPCHFEQVITTGALRTVRASFASTTLGATVFSELLVAQLKERTKATFSKAVERLRSCHRFATGESGLGPMIGQAFPFPSVGEASAGFVFVVSIGGVKIPQYLDVARFEGVLTTFSGIGGSTSQFETLLKTASAKIEKVL
jgi:hypothetical protein